MRLNKNLKYKRETLLKVLKENHKKHLDNYGVALRQYGKELKEELENKLSRITAGELVEGNSSLVRPEEHTSDYDRAIRMFEMTTEEEIELDQSTFCQLVMDEWDWKRNFSANTLSYSMKALAAN